MDTSRFTGSEKFTRFSPIHKGVLSEGAQYVAEEAGAYWLFDLVASHITAHDDYFAVCTLKVEPTIVEGSTDPDYPDGEYSAVAILDDGNGNEFARQPIVFTDFPEPEFSFYAGRYGERKDEWTYFLKSEY
jgi:hypothetical protein